MHVDMLVLRSTCDEAGSCWRSGDHLVFLPERAEGCCSWSIGLCVSSFGFLTAARIQRASCRGGPYTV
jgi:hypothetical protein